jgi:hypothetical protein
MTVARSERLLPDKYSSYWLTRFVMLRLLGILYAISAGVWRDREQLGMWLPPLSADMPELREVLRDANWLPASAAERP